MLIAEKLNEKINEQIVNEYFAAQTYLAMACMFKQQGLHLLAKMFRKQASEEREHAEKFIDYILDRQGKVRLGEIPAPQTDWDSVLAALEAAEQHELKVSEQIENLHALADELNDRTSQTFLDWFIDEQIEEVRTMHDMVQVARQSGPAIVMIEAYLVHIGED